MSLFKLPLLFLSSISWHLAHDRPSSPDAEDKIIVTSIRERIWGHAGLPCCLYFKGTTWLTTIAESMVILDSLRDTPRSSTNIISVVLDALGPAQASRLTVPFVLGALLVTAGGIIRIQCYRTLGASFTFEQCIRKEHKLITTGPYAVVRHPGYTGMMMCILGSCVMYGEPGAWLRASGVLGGKWIRVVAAVWCFTEAAVFTTLLYRVGEEDRFLAEKFGKEWESWARRVKYKLVPFVY